MDKLSTFEWKFLMEPEIRPYCGPLMFITSLNSAVGTIKANGSFGLVDTGKKQLLVTCYHVWDEFQKLREKNSDLRLAVCLYDVSNPVIFTPDGPIGEDQSLDIATFDMKPLLAACGRQKFYSLNQNHAAMRGLARMGAKTATIQQIIDAALDDVPFAAVQVRGIGGELARLGQCV